MACIRLVIPGLRKPSWWRVAGHRPDYRPCGWPQHQDVKERLRYLYQYTLQTGCRKSCTNVFIQDVCTLTASLAPLHHKAAILAVLIDVQLHRCTPPSARMYSTQWTVTPVLPVPSVHVHLLPYLKYVHCTCSICTLHVHVVSVHMVRCTGDMHYLYTVHVVCVQVYAVQRYPEGSVQTLISTLRPQRNRSVLTCNFSKILTFYF